MAIGLFGILFFLAAAFIVMNVLRAIFFQNQFTNTVHQMLDHAQQQMAATTAAAQSLTCAFCGGTIPGGETACPGCGAARTEKT